MIRCFAVWRRVIPATGGAWIPYTAAQVVARRAAQMVLVIVCTSVPVPPGPDRPRLPSVDHPPPAVWHPPPGPVWYLPPPTPWHPPHGVPGYAPPAQNIPEPGTAVLFAVALLGLLAMRIRWGRQAPPAARRACWRW